MMRAGPSGEMIENYLGRLREALRSTPAERREQVVSDVAQHIAEALAEEPDPNEQTVASVLDRIGTPEEIAAALDEDSGADRNSRPHGSRQATPDPPAPVRTAVRLMYLGAAISVVAAFGDLLTRSELKSFFRNGTNLAHRLHGLPKLTPSQLNSAVTDNLAMAVIIWLVSVLLWLFIARAITTGQSSARGTALVSSCSTA